MTSSQRVLLAVGFLLLDWAAFFVPLGSIVIAYILITRPPWFKDWVLKMYESS